MSIGLPDRDERTQAVENAGYRWSYLTLSFGLLVIVAFRSFVFREATWDLLALVIVGGGVNAAYQASRRVLHARWLVITLVTFLLAALLAAGMALVRPSLQAQGTKPAPSVPSQQTAAQFYLEYRAAFDKATKLDDILPFRTAEKREEAEAMPARVRDLGLQALKAMKTVNDVKVLTEEKTADGVRLTVEGVRPGRRKTGTVTIVKGTVTIVKEAGAWKIGAEKWN